MPVPMLRLGFLIVISGTTSIWPALFVLKLALKVRLPLPPVSRMAATNSVSFWSPVSSSSPRRKLWMNSRKLSS
ncbi:hypothetical protein [Paracoccus yeei]|uniref:hypothetical protein n=1 Tax=Paracoccus yeei TaxID=147645 RepID=UPI003BF7AE06